MGGTLLGALTCTINSTEEKTGGEISSGHGTSHHSDTGGGAQFQYSVDQDSEGWGIRNEAATPSLSPLTTTRLRSTSITPLPFQHV